MLLSSIRAAPLHGAQSHSAKLGSSCIVFASSQHAISAVTLQLPSPGRRYAKGGNISTCNPYGPNVDPTTVPREASGTCPALQMFKMDTQFYVDLCTPSVSMFDYTLDVGLKDLDDATYKENLKDMQCSFTSQQFRKVSRKEAGDGEQRSFAGGYGPWGNVGNLQGGRAVCCSDSGLPEGCQGGKAVCWLHSAQWQQWTASTPAGALVMCGHPRYCTPRDCQ